MDERALRRAFSHILAGKSPAQLSHPVWIRHQDIGLSVETDLVYEKAYQSARQNRALTEVEALEYAQKQGLWTAADELEIKSCERTILALEDNKTISFSPTEVENYKKQMKEERGRMEKKLAQKMDILGLTCETIARRRSNAYYVYLSIYKDAALSEQLYTPEQFEELDEEDLITMVVTYNMTMEPCYHVQQIAAASFFQDRFRLTEDVYQFYGRPICHLTDLQAQLAIWGCYFQHTFRELGDTLPLNIRNDPEKIVEWTNMRRNFDKVLSKTPEGASVGINLSRADMKFLGVDKMADNVESQRAKMGKRNLSAEELARIRHG